MSLTVKVQRPDGTTDDLKTIDYSSLEGEAKWATEMIMLDAYASLPYVRLKFAAAGGEGETRPPLYVDNVNVSSVAAHDLAASVASSRAGVAKGGNAKVSVTVGNKGTEAARDFTVSLYEGDIVVGMAVESAELASAGSKSYDFVYTPSVFAKDAEAELRAEVTYDGDENTENNTATLALRLSDPVLPRPENVTVRTADGTVVVSWNAPSVLEASVTESFEDYPTWSRDTFGEWTTIDGDGGFLQPVYTQTPYPGQGDKAAYILFDPDDYISNLTVTSPETAAHSGRKYLASIFSATAEGTADADDWLVSPVVADKEQAISFWVSNLNDAKEMFPQTFRVYASKTGTSREDFTQVGEEQTVWRQEWKKIDAILPKGTKHFAIRNCTEKSHAFFFMLDDITYTVSTPAPTAFYVYRDGEIIGSAETASPTFTDTEAPEGEHIYSVTAAYPDGESMPESVNVGGATAITDVASDRPASFTVHTLDGRLVARGLHSLDSLPRGVYIVNDKKTVVK